MFLQCHGNKSGLFLFGESRKADKQYARGYEFSAKHQFAEIFIERNEESGIVPGVLQDYIISYARTHLGNIQY